MSVFSGSKSKENCLMTHTEIYIPTYRYITMTQNLNQICPKFFWALVKWPKKYDLLLMMDDLRESQYII